ncbi:MAG TPA: VWA domain-containing protein [Casimicrobiaceae bacterium]
MPIQLDLNKSARNLRLSLDKVGVATQIKAELVFIIDVSGSFEHEHEEGTTSLLLQRLVPYGMVLDPDGKMDVFTFSGGARNAHYVGTVTPEDSDNYLVRNVCGRVPGWGDGTTYSYVLEKALRHLGWMPQEQQGGFFSRFFGRPAEQTPVQKKRSIIIFVTDGENDKSDEARTMRVLEDSQRRGDQVYFLFLGTCDEHVNFEFLQTIARQFKNTGAIIERDVEGFVKESDEAINARLLRPELIEWLKS